MGEEGFRNEWKRERREKNREEGGDRAAYAPVALLQTGQPLLVSPDREGTRACSHALHEFPPGLVNKLEFLALLQPHQSGNFGAPVLSEVWLVELKHRDKILQAQKCPCTRQREDSCFSQAWLCPVWWSFPASGATKQRPKARRKAAFQGGKVMTAFLTLL